MPTETAAGDSQSAPTTTPPALVPVVDETGESDSEPTTTVELTSTQTQSVTIEVEENAQQTPAATEDGAQETAASGSGAGSPQDSAACPAPSTVTVTEALTSSVTVTVVSASPTSSPREIESGWLNVSFFFSQTATSTPIEAVEAVQVETVSALPSLTTAPFRNDTVSVTQPVLASTGFITLKSLTSDTATALPTAIPGIEYEVAAAGYRRRY